jgi:ATP phosphoribosyltransferase regulatory subunit
VFDVDVRIGDVALFAALLDALNLAPVWRRRLTKDFNRKVSVAQDLERLTLQTKGTRPDYQGVLSALAGSDRKAALAMVADLMSIAGATNVGGRSTAEIADRFLEQSTLAASLPGETAALIERFLAISGEPDAALAKLREFVTDTRIDISRAIDQLESRIGFMAARGLDTRAMRFATAFGRGVDYYTGFEFELHRRNNGAEPLVAGGRYDGLMTRLGSRQPIAAVGFSVWIETLAQAGGVS